MYEKIKTEIERRWRELADKNVKAGGNVYDCEIAQLLSLLSFIESLEKEEQEDTDFVKQELERIRESQKKVKLPELIDFWWMQEDMEGNQMISKAKEHFASAMRKAYNVGLSQSESMEKEQDADLDFQRFAKEIDAVFALPSSQTKNTDEQPLNWEYAIARHFYELGLSAKENAPKIKGWVARDKDGTLVLYGQKPDREIVNWDDCGTDEHICINRNMFPYLKWEDEPIEVELLVKRV